MTRRVKIAALIVIGTIVIAVAIYFAVFSDTTEYVGGQSGCERGRVVMSDITEGVLRESAMVLTLGEIVEETQFAEPDIASSALGMVKAVVVSGDLAELTSAGQAFYDACDSAGY